MHRKDELEAVVDLEEGHRNDGPHTRIIAGVEIQFARGRFFVDPSQWTEEVFHVLAREAGVEEINEKQRMVIHFIRKFYMEKGRIPLNHHIRVGTRISLVGLEAMFPGGIKYGAFRLAGLPDPKLSCGGVD